MLRPYSAVNFDDIILKVEGESDSVGCHGISWIDNGTFTLTFDIIMGGNLKNRFANKTLYLEYQSNEDYWERQRLITFTLGKFVARRCEIHDGKVLVMKYLFELKDQTYHILQEEEN